jgi:hypothetical protein
MRPNQRISTLQFTTKARRLERFTKKGSGTEWDVVVRPRHSLAEFFFVDLSNLRAFVVNWNVDKLWFGGSKVLSGKRHSQGE